jgi:hypothetical protein
MAPGFAEADQSFHTQALTRLANMETQSMQHRMANEDAMMKLAQGADAPKNLDQQITQMEAQAGRLMAGGFVKQGSDLFEKASLARSHQATVRREQFQEEEKARQHRIDSIKTINTMLETVTDERSYNAMLERYKMENPGDEIPEQFQHYNPELVRMVRLTSPQAIKREEEERKKKKDEFEQELKERQEKDRERRTDIEDRRARTMEAAEARREKAEGKNAGKVGKPNKEEIAAAGELVSEEFPDLKPNIISGPQGRDSHTAAANELAERTEAVFAANKGMSKDEARETAFREMKDAGDFKKYTVREPIKAFGIPLPFASTEEQKTAYKPGRTKESPRDLPADKKLKDGLWYQTPQGVLRWDAKKQKLVDE